MYNQSQQEQRMDHNAPDSASEHAPASEHADLVSNLSTMPNISEQNDPVFDQPAPQQGPNDPPAEEEQGKPIYLQRINSHGSSISNHAINPLSSHFSALPHLNQVHPEQRRENYPLSNPVTAAKNAGLSVFDEQWERTFKEEQDERERSYQNHVLLNQDNEPLLSQNYDPLLSQNEDPLISQNQEHTHDVTYSQNEPLLSQNAVPEHEYTHNQEYEALLSQHSQAIQELQSIDESNQEDKSQARSNQVKYQHFQPIQEVAYNQDSRSQHSSNREFSQPLFEMKVNDESQSNLLKFGFSVSKKDRNGQEAVSFKKHHEIPAPSLEQSVHNQMQNGEVPMDIQKHPSGDQYSNHYQRNEQILMDIQKHPEPSYNSNHSIHSQHSSHLSHQHNSNHSHNQVHPNNSNHTNHQIHQNYSNHSNHSNRQNPSNHSSQINQDHSQREEEHSHPLVKVQAPMEIEQHAIQILVGREEPSNTHSQDRGITIQVTKCPSLNLNSVSKNNDIYGINPQQDNHSRSNASQKVEEAYQPPYQHEYHDEAPQQSEYHNQQLKHVHEQVKESSQNVPAASQRWANNDQKQEQVKEQNSITVRQQEKEGPKEGVDNALQQCFEAIADYVPNLPQEQPPTLEQIARKMDQIANADLPGHQKTQEGSKLLKDHIDIWFNIPTSEIGQEIISNGETAVNFIKIVLAKQTDNALKRVLEKYLLLTFDKKLTKNQQALKAYQQAIAPEISQRMVSSANRVNLSQQQPSNQPSVIHESQPEIPNQSVHAENGSSSKKNVGQQMDIVGEREPIKRTLRNKNIIAVQSTAQSGKVTRKGRPKNKTSVKKKSNVKFDDVNQTQEPDRQQVVSPDRNSRKKESSKSVVKRASKKKEQSQEQTESVHLGSKYTFIMREDNRSHQKVLVQKRVSQRLATKQQAQRSGSKSNQRQLRKRSSAKRNKFQEQSVDLDYIRQNREVIRVLSVIMEDDFDGLTDKDEEIAEIIRRIRQIEDQEEALSRNQQSHHSNEESSHVQFQDHTVASVHSVHSNHSRHSSTSLMARRLQFKNNLSKYKVGEIPIMIERVVDPDINDHGIYALLELGRMSRFIHNARFAVTPITSLARAPKKTINEDYAQAKRIVGEEQKDNIVYIQANSNILDMIKVEKDRRARVAA